MWVCTFYECAPLMPGVAATEVAADSRQARMLDSILSIPAKW